MKQINYISDTEEIIYARLEASVVKDMSDTAKNIDFVLQNEISLENNSSFFELLKDKVDLRTKLEEKLILPYLLGVQYLDRNDMFLQYKSNIATSSRKINANLK